EEERPVGDARVDPRAERGPDGAQVVEIEAVALALDVQVAGAHAEGQGGERAAHLRHPAGVRGQPGQREAQRERGREPDRDERREPQPERESAEPAHLRSQARSKLETEKLTSSTGPSAASPRVRIFSERTIRCDCDVSIRYRKSTAC